MRSILKMKVIAILAVLLLASASPALASDLLPADMTPEQKWQLKADYGWDMYQRGFLASPCENDAFVDIYGAWFGC